MQLFTRCEDEQLRKYGLPMDMSPFSYLRFQGTFDFTRLLMQLNDEIMFHDRETLHYFVWDSIVAYFARSARRSSWTRKPTIQKPTQNLRASVGQRTIDSSESFHTRLSLAFPSSTATLRMCHKQIGQVLKIW